MIKLKDIVKEFDLQGGDADGDIDVPKDIRRGLFDTVYNRDPWDDGGDDEDDEHDIPPIRENDKAMRVINKYVIGKIGDDFVITFTRELDGYQYSLLNLNATHTGEYTTDDESLIAGVIVVTQDKEVGYGGFNPQTTFQLPKSTKTIHWSYLSENFRGQGLGAKLYDTALDHAGALISDSTLFTGSFIMWTHHMSKKKFFGVLVNKTRAVGKNSILIPVDGTVAGNIDFVEDRGNRFVAISDMSSVPDVLMKFRTLLRGIDVTKELLVYDTSSKLSTKITLLEDLDSSNVFDESIVDDLKKGIDIVDFFENYVDGFDHLNKIQKFIEEKDIDVFGLPMDIVWWPQLKGKTLANYLDGSKIKNITTAFISLQDAVLVLKESGDGLTVDIV